MIGALIGGGVSAIGSLISAAQRRKALREQQQALQGQRSSALNAQTAALNRYSNTYQNIIQGAQSMQSLNLDQARGMYGGLVDEAQLQRQGLLDTADRLGSEFTAEQQRLSGQAIQRGQDRLAMSQGGRVAGEEAMMDAVRRGTAESASRIRNVGGTGSNVLAAINQAVSAGNQRELQVESQLGGIREQRAAQARAGLEGAEMRGEQGRLAAMQYAGGLQYGAQQTGNSLLMQALGQQAGFEGQAGQAEYQSAFQQQQYTDALRRGLADQMLEGDISKEQTNQMFQSQINQTNLDRNSSSLVGGLLQGIGTGFMGATQLAADTPAGGRGGFANFLMGGARPESTKKVINRG